MRKHLATWVTLASLWLGSAMGMANAAVEANRAPPEDLMTIRGIGPATSQRIVEARAERPFASWPDFIQRVHGVGPVRAARMSEQGLTVNGQPLDGGASVPAGDAAQAPIWQPMTPQPLLIPHR